MRNPITGCSQSSIKSLLFSALALLHRELARELVAQVWPDPLRPLGIKFFLVSIGPPVRAREFCALTGFPEDHLLADPDNVLYDALGMRRDVASLFFNVAVRVKASYAASALDAWLIHEAGQLRKRGLAQAVMKLHCSKAAICSKPLP